MNILQLISSEGFFGAESMLTTLSQSLVRLGCNVAVGVFRDARNPHIEVAEAAANLGLDVKLIDCSRRFDPGVSGRIRAVLTEHRADVLHTHGYKADLYGYAASRPRRAVTLSTCHNWPSRALLMRGYAVLDRVVLKNFDRVTTPSDQVADILKESGIEPSRLSRIPNGVDMGRFEAAPPALREELGCGEKPLIGFVGRFVPGKGGETLLHAAKVVLASQPRAQFVFVGEGPLGQNWQALAAELGIAEHVVFAGVRRDMPSVYASLDMLVLPSFNEAMPMCLLEGLASGNAVIATNVGAIPELVLDGKTGTLIEPGDATALAEAILRLLGNPEMRRDLGHAGRAHMARHHSSDAMARQYLGLYEQALAERMSGELHHSRARVAG